MTRRRRARAARDSAGLTALCCEELAVIAERRRGEPSVRSVRMSLFGEPRAGSTQSSRFAARQSYAASWQQRESRSNHQQTPR
jgi:hypothetical protein